MEIDSLKLTEHQKDLLIFAFLVIYFILLMTRLIFFVKDVPVFS